MYEYKAYVRRVYDGDTITVDLDLGFGISFFNQTLRLARINTPEVRGMERDQGLESRDWLRDQILGKEIIVKTFKDTKGKYGRYIAEIYLNDVCMNDELVQKGLAEYVEY